MAKYNKRDKLEITKDDIKLNDLAQDIFKKISLNTYDMDRERNANQIDNIVDKVDKVINSDLDEMKSYGGKNDLTRFLLNTLQNSGKYTGTINDLNNSDTDLLENIFLSKDGSIFATFEERFKSKALLFHDLEIISEQLVELSEAINTTRDDIVASDDLGSDISRSLSFSSSANEEDYDDIIEEVKDLEKEYSLSYMIREHIVPKTLKYGEYYVYIIPESKLFENAQRNNLKSTSGATLESTEVDTLLENLDIDKNGEFKDINSDDILTYVSENIRINNTDVPLPLLEGTNMPGMMQDLTKFNNLNNLLKQGKNKKSKKKKGEDTIQPTIGFSDGVKSARIDNWDGIKGCYIKLLDPKKVIPVKLMNYTIGYYYINDADLDITNHHCRSHAYRFGSLLDQVANKSENQHSIVTSIANSIVKSFDKKYLNDNQEFKELIINSLLYNDMYKRKLHYQFIPADNICRFSINEDENGNGQSMIYKSLFYAKLYLSLLTFNMITWLTKSQDTIVTYVKTSGIDKNVVNKTMSIARQMKSRQIGIGDLMDYSSIYGKIGTGRDIFLPEGESGERGLSWDVIQGQDVNMQNEFMEMLKEAFINGTGVPSVIMNYINEADFAKTLVMANAKQLRRVMMFQDSLNEDITEMYQKIMLYCTDIELDDILEFSFKFQRPKSLPNNNLVDTMTYGDQLLDFLEKTLFGQFAEENEDLNLIKDEFRKTMSRKVLSMLPWETADEVLEEVMLKVKQEKVSKPTSDNADGTGDSMEY